MLVLMCMELCVISLFHRKRRNQHFLQTFDDVYGKMCGENNLKNGALKIDFSTTALPPLTVVRLILFLPSSAMTEIIDFELFPSYVLNYNTLCFEDIFVFHLQACFFQNRSCYMVIIYTVMHSNIRHLQ